MNHAGRLFIATGILAAAASAMASEAEQWSPPGGRQARAGVLAQLHTAEATGEMNGRNEAYGNVEGVPHGVLSRTRVLAELRDAERAGDMDRRTEAYGTVDVLPHDTLDRAPVQAEGTRAMHARAHAFEAADVGD